MEYYDAFGNDVTLEIKTKILVLELKLEQLEKRNKRLKKKLEKCDKLNCC